VLVQKGANLFTKGQIGGGELQVHGSCPRRRKNGWISKRKA